MNRHIFIVGLLYLSCNSLHGLAAEIREWRSGRHTVKAEFVALKDGKVTLKRNGKETKISLAKLSKSDQQYVKQQIAAQATTKPDTKKSLARQQRAIRSAAVKFLTILGKQDEEALKEVVTSRADSSDAALSKFPKPDRQSPKYVRQVEIKGKQATANISYKVSGRLKKYKITLANEDSDWRVLSFVGDDDEVIQLAKVDPEEERRANQRSRSKERDEEDADDPDQLFADDDDDGDDQELASGKTDDEPARADGESLALPNDPVEIVAYIKKQQKKRPSSTDDEAVAEFVKQQSQSLLEATDRILSDYDVGKKEIEFAVSTKFTTLQALIKYDPEGAAYAVEDFLIKLEDLELEQHLPRANTLVLTSELAIAEKGNEIKIVVRDVVSHLKKMKKLSSSETELAKMALKKSAKLGEEAAAETKKSLDSILAKAT